MARPKATGPRKHRTGQWYDTYSDRNDTYITKQGKTKIRTKFEYFGSVKEVSEAEANQRWQKWKTIRELGYDPELRQQAITKAIQGMKNLVGCLESNAPFMMVPRSPKDQTPVQKEANHLFNEFLADAAGFGENEPTKTDTTVTSVIVEEPKRLSDALKYWQDLKRSQVSLSHLKDYATKFQNLIEFTKNPMVSDLTEGHFRGFQLHILNQKKSANWINIQNKAIKTVITTVRPLTHTWDWSERLYDWVQVKPQGHVVNEDSSEPMPPDDFKACLETSQTWQIFNGENKQKGYMMEVSYMLLCQTAINVTDLTRLERKHLHALHTDKPYHTLPRIKVAKKVGKEIARACPLLSETQERLNYWLDNYAGPSLVFPSDVGTPMDKSRFSELHKQLKTAAKVKGSLANLANLRNVGVSLCDETQAHISEAQQQVFMGHTISKSVLARYKSQKPRKNPEFVRPIVDLIHTAYF